ncbi:MAG: hypothetical protein KGL10_05310 [Alphaproteobacteria bacterium]|nr:hypothetical protein [Alphaproteobacteria bacterium]
MNAPEQIPFALETRGAFGREDFWVSDCNRAAVAWLDRYPDWPAPAFVITGPPASGKTHLCNVWRQKSGAAEMESVEAMQERQEGPLPAVIDDAMRFIGDSEKEEHLFHLYNFLQGQGAHMLLTAAKPVAEWPFVLPDLKSRLMAAPAAALGSPDDALMAIVLAKLFSDRQVFVPQGVIGFIVPRIERSFAAMRRVVDETDRRALSQKRPVTVPLMKEIL